MTLMISFNDEKRTYERQR